ncbi:MAG: CHAD domain-containing protein [Thermoanaerobaculia bacterium]
MVAARRSAELPGDLLARPAEEAVRRLALFELGRAEAAREALVAGDRDEALHDFRVALRRLRSLLRSHRGEFSLDYPKKPLRRMAAIARDTNPGRDAEVQLAWVESLAPQLTPAERTGHGELARHLAERRDESYRKVEREIVRDFGELADDLRKRLATYRIEMRLDRRSRATSLARATRTAIGHATTELFARLDAISSAADEEEGHVARIAAKRLRYLAEPLAPWIVEAKAPIARLKRLQDLLGELHDGQLLAAHVASSLGELESRRAHRLVAETLDLAGAAPAERPRGVPSRRRERSGLLAVARALGERRQELFAQIEKGWLGAEAPERTALSGELAVVDERLGRPLRRRPPKRPTGSAAAAAKRSP